MSINSADVFKLTLKRKDRKCGLFILTYKNEG